MSQMLPSLLDSIETPAGPVQRGPGPVARLRARLNAGVARLTADPARRRKLVLAGRWGGGAAVIALGLGAYFILRPVPKPDYESAPIDEIFNYTLLTDEFNKLPIDERVRLVGQIVQRIKTMGSGDSALLAAFAAGIMGQAREQLQKNASKMAVDLWDKYAIDYARVPEDERGEYIEGTIVEFMKTMEGIAGESRNISDADRLAELRGQAKRDAEELQRPGSSPSGRQMGRMFDFMNEGVGGAATPAQRVRGAQLMRDMVRHLRGGDLATGKPK
ncbi:MAG: hypothetical protein IT436_01440 [Phycisphaerales bacterium]|nr:hypothetical protein [Phycisphaerales bacterium]